MTRWTHAIRTAAYASSFAAMLEVLRATWRTRTGEISLLDDLLGQGRRVIGCFWHGDYIPLFVLMRNRDALVFTSASFRGQVISRLCVHFGYRAAMIPEHGEEAYRQMKEAATGTRLVAIATDGPLGPHHVPKRGTIRLSSDLDMALVPISVASSSRWIDSKRWDHRTLPRPFSTVSITVGKPLSVPANLTESDIGAWQIRLAEELELTDRRAKQLLRDRF